MAEDLKDAQRKYWDRRARGEVSGVKKKLLALFFRTGYVGLRRLRERRIVSNQLKGTRILDVGCGDGAFMAKLAKWNPERTFVGIDFSEPMIAIARRRGLDASVMDMCLLEFEPGSFATVYALRSVKNILDREGQRESLRAMCRVASERVIIYDTFERAGADYVPDYNRPLIIDDVVDTARSCGFTLIRRMFATSEIFVMRSTEQQVSSDGCLVFDRHGAIV